VVRLWSYGLRRFLIRYVGRWVGTVPAFLRNRWFFHQGNVWKKHLLGAFAKFRKATIYFVMSVRLSAWKNSAPTGRIFMKFHFWLFIETLSRKYKFHENRTRIKDTLPQDQYTFSIIPLSILLRMKLFQIKIVEKFETYILEAITFFFPENRAVY